MKEKRRIRLSELGLVLAAILWGTAFAVVKDTNHLMPPSWQIGIRFTFAAALMLLLFHKRLKSMNRKALLLSILMGTILFIAYLVQTIGVKYTTAGRNAFLTAIYVVIVPFLSWGLHRAHPGAVNLFAAVLCLTGIGMLSLAGGHFGLGLGEGLSIVSGILYAVHIMITSSAITSGDPMAVNTVQFAVCGVLALLCGAFTEPPPTLNQQAVLSLGYLSIFSSAIGMGLQSVCQRYVETSKASLLMSLESVFGCLSGILLLGETLTIQTVIGFVLIFAAIVLTEMPAEKHSRLPVPASSAAGQS
ncbi:MULTISPECIES: DMT family transporter [Caproicibacterium]|uniref:DMT family transporter n=1 Tax=Caproicibacterium TaxID=2834348 RepID=UPI0015736CD6|nr:DMT family transporter [Caproicibacterium lactatifermentans]MDD4808127.1 DMT family transporter [Oscillospiraceae bacterium]